MQEKLFSDSDDDFYSKNVHEWNRDQEAPNGFVFAEMRLMREKTVAEILRRLCPLLAGNGCEKQRESETISIFFGD